LGIGTFGRSPVPRKSTGEMIRLLYLILCGNLPTPNRIEPENLPVKELNRCEHLYGRLSKTVLLPDFVVITAWETLRSVREIEFFILPKWDSISIRRLAD